MVLTLIFSFTDLPTILMLTETSASKREHAAFFCWSAAQSGSWSSCSSICIIQGESIFPFVKCFMKSVFRIYIYFHLNSDASAMITFLYAFHRFLAMSMNQFLYLLQQKAQMLDRLRQSFMSLSLAPNQVSDCHLSDILFSWCFIY